MVDMQANNFTINNNTEFSIDYDPFDIEELNCSICTNELCFPDSDYQLYEEWISVNDFETVLIILHTIQIFTGILGNLLVSLKYFYYFILFASSTYLAIFTPTIILCDFDKNNLGIN